MCGKGGAGYCVKMHHNAGEDAVLQLLGEPRHEQCRHQGKIVVVEGAWRS